MGLNKIAIFLRKEQRNRFRELILQTFNCSSVSEMILCSGFFQEPYCDKKSKKITYSSSASFIYNNKDSKIIQLVGVHNENWAKRYEKFYKNLTKIKNLTVKKFIVKNKSWHAKVMIGKSTMKEPLITIIGSSNITHPAFDNDIYFNYESDVLLWDDTNSEINDFVHKIFSDNTQEFTDVIVSDYSDENQLNGNVLLNEKIKQLEKDIFDNAILENNAK